MTKEAFVDLPIHVSMVGGVVRMTFGELEGEVKEGQEPKINEKIKMFIPLEGFLRTYGAMQDVVEKMEKEGVLKKKEAAPIAASAQ